MAGLQIQQKANIPFWRISFVLVFIVLLSAGGWYAYRWYTTGEQPPLVSVASADPRVDESDVPASKIESYTVAATSPRYISIPSIDVRNARVLKVGIDAQNMLEMPKNIHDTGWFERSATPGRGYGAVLIDGHSTGASSDGVFKDLKTLEIGDQITIERGDGKKFTYEVVENQSMPLEKVLSSGMKAMMLSAESDKEGLSLIANDGKWIPRYQQFDRRIMLRAVLVD